jgi:2'-5' RNA ligase
MPTGVAYDILARTIAEIALELNGPVFEPHVSLIGNLDGSESEIADRTAELGHKLDPFTITLSEASYLDDHFRCLFMLVQQDPSLMKAYTVASDLFKQPKQAFLPHLSLAYASAGEAQKKSLIRRLSSDIRMNFEATALSLIRADSLAPKDWHEIGRFPMDCSVVSAEIG